MILKKSNALILILFSSHLFASPDVLEYHNKPIDPLCFTSLEKQNNVIDLQSCGIDTQSNLKIKGTNALLKNKGYIGFDYTRHLSSGKWQEYSYYKPIIINDDSFIIHSVSNFGGTGVFTSIDIVKRKDNKLYFSSLEGGDRCNGGVGDIKLQPKTNAFEYAQNLTPYQMVKLADDNPFHLSPYDDLDDCAACCVAKAIYQRSPTDHYQSSKLISIKLNPFEMDENISDPKRIYQHCFNQRLVAYLKHAKSNMTMTELKIFIHDFNECVATQKSAHT